MKEAFIEKKFQPETVSILDMTKKILLEYQAQGYKLSLRQLYYQFIQRDLFPDSWRDKETGSKNNLHSYKRLGNMVSDGRQAGLIDWDMIEDRGRTTTANSHWRTPGDIIRSAAYSFKIDKWVDQDWHIEVMVEKDALSGVLEPVCLDLDIAITANKGYSSSSTMYEIGKRLERALDHDKQICIIYLGDHDPSGIDMTRDVEERLGLYSRSINIEVVRAALNFDQVEVWNPPPNPAKETDARFEVYRRKFGEECWELDAVEPATLADLVRQEVYTRRDDEAWDAAVAKEAGMIDTLNKLAKTYSKEQ